MTLFEKDLERGVMGRADDMARADRDGWSRAWMFGGPHYFPRSCAYALCGSGVNQHHKLTLTPVPDGDLPEGQRKTACPHCAKLLKEGRRGHAR